MPLPCSRYASLPPLAAWRKSIAGKVIVAGLAAATCATPLASMQVLEPQAAIAAPALMPASIGDDVRIWTPQETLFVAADGIESSPVFVCVVAPVLPADVRLKSAAASHKSGELPCSGSVYRVQMCRRQACDEHGVCGETIALIVLDAATDSGLSDCSR